MLAAKDEDVETKGASDRQSITPLLAAETRLLTNTLSVHRTFFTHVRQTESSSNIIVHSMLLLCFARFATLLAPPVYVLRSLLYMMQLILTIGATGLAL